MFLVTYRGLINAADTLRHVPEAEPGDVSLYDDGFRDELYPRFRSFAEFYGEPNDSRILYATRKWLQLVRYARLAWAESGWHGYNTNVTDEIVARGWEDTAGLGNTSAREGVFHYICLEEGLQLFDGALVFSSKRDPPPLPFFDTPGCEAHIEALCAPTPFKHLSSDLFDEATLAPLRLRRGVDEFCDADWRAVCAEERFLRSSAS